MIGFLTPREKVRLVRLSLPRNDGVVVTNRGYAFRYSTGLVVFSAMNVVPLDKFYASTLAAGACLPVEMRWSMVREARRIRTQGKKRY